MLVLGEVVVLVWGFLSDSDSEVDIGDKPLVSLVLGLVDLLDHLVVSTVVLLVGQGVLCVGGA